MAQAVRGAGSRLLAPQRLMGIDVARGLALIGMMSVHILPPLEPDGSGSWAYRISAGRASALFAVLAGLSLVLAHGRRAAGVEDGTRRAVAARAIFIASLGLVLGTLGSGVAVILVHYAVLFMIGTASLSLRARSLLCLGVAWLALSPAVSQLVRPLLPRGPGASPSLFSLLDPVGTVTAVLVTGYYPVLQWTGYLLIGMGLARLPLRRAATGGWLLIGGAVVAVAAKSLSALLLGPAGGLELLTAQPAPVAGRTLPALLQTGLYGTTPTETWWWLAIAAPHSGTPLDLLHTAGTATAVIGGCLLVVAVLRGRWRWGLLPVAAAGSMTLTLYSAHVFALAASPQDPSIDFWLLNVVLALVLATAWQLGGRRGPLESVASRASSAARHRRPLHTPAG